MSSTTFDAQLDVAGKVAEESPELYFEIQALNDYGKESLDALAMAVERLRSAVASNDQVAFAVLMQQGLDYLQGVNQARRATTWRRAAPCALSPSRPAEYKGSWAT